MGDRSQMRVVTVHGPGDVRIDMAEQPEVGSDDVLLQLRACGVCGTDVHYINSGGTSRRHDSKPMPIGHEVSGDVIAVGSAIASVRPGDRMIVNPMAGSAIIGNGGSEGGFSDYLLVRDAASTTALLPIPAGLSYADAALAEPLAVSLRAVNRAAPREGETAVVYGAGPIGLGIILWLKHRGVANVIAIDFSERRLGLALAIGADIALNATASDDEVAARIIAAHGATDVFGAPVAGTDMYFDAAGAPAVIRAVVSLAKTASRFVIVAMHGAESAFDMMQFMGKEMTMTGSVGYREELGDALKALPEIGDLARTMVTDIFCFDDVLAGLGRAAEGDSGKVIIEFPAKLETA